MSATLTFVVLLAMLICCAVSENIFPDKNLEAAVRNALGKPITVDRLANLTMLAVNGSDIVDLSGLEYCTNLALLYLWDNQISEISPLVENDGLGEGDEVLLGDNELDLTEGSEDMQNIRALQDRGVHVSY